MGKKMAGCAAKNHLAEPALRIGAFYDKVRAKLLSLSQQNGARLLTAVSHRYFASVNTICGQTLLGLGARGSRYGQALDGEDRDRLGQSQ